MNNFRFVSFLSALTAILSLGISALAAPTKPTILPAVKRKPNYATGRCVNSAGKPLSKVRIRVFGTTMAGQRTVFDTKTDANGVYSVLLPKGNYNVGWALYDTPAPAGPPYSLPLFPKDGNSDDEPSGPGIVENFVLKISGLISPLKDKENYLSYYGGSIRVFGGALANGNFLDGYSYRFSEGSSVELTLVPQGKLVDGSTGKTLVRRQKISGSGATILDIPIGQYSVTAKLFEANGTEKPLRVAVARYGTGYGPTKFTPEATEFKADGKLYFAASSNATSVLSMTAVSQADIYVQP